MTRRLTIDDLAAVCVPSAPTLSPEGASIVYTVRTLDADNDSVATNLWSVADETAPRQLTFGDTDSSPTFSPDGRRIAFLRAVDGVDQLHLLNVDGGEARVITTLRGGAGAAAWSPDGNYLAFVAAVDTDATESSALAPIVVSRLDAQVDGVGYLGAVRSQLHVLNVVDGAVRQLTFGGENADAPAWSPDGRTLAYTSGSAEGGHPLCRPVWMIDAHDVKADPACVALAEGYAESVLWTADAGSLIVVGSLDLLGGHARLLRVDLGTKGGACTGTVDLGAALDRNVMSGAPAYPGASPALIDDGQRVLFCVRDRGLTHLYSVAVAGGAEPVAVLAGSGRLVAGMSVAAGTAAVVVATRDSYGEIVTLDLATGSEVVRTQHGAVSGEGERYGWTERTFNISDGAVVHGWVLSAPEQIGPRPLLLDVHGGPHNAWSDVADEMHAYHHELVAAGWAVLIVNPRGSDGYGEEFFRAVDAAWGISDASDFLEPIEALVAEGLADPQRLAVAGYSYGGYMACYLTGHDSRFAAAVAGGVVSDLVSMVGPADLSAQFTDVELGGPPWEDAARYAAMSPLSHVAEVRTPTLILHGEADRRCPVGQAQQWYFSLKHRGVPTEMVLYPGASHIFPLAGRLSHRLDYNRRIVEWLERFAGDAAGPRPVPLDEAHWRRRTEELARRHQIVGAQLGILRLSSRDDDMVRAATGTLNKLTGVPVTVDSIFQIGSISKVWTTTIIMQLVEEGKFTLDTPIVEILPDFRLSDPEAQDGVTIRHLLTHTSGIDGDIFTDIGRGDDAVAKLVELLAESKQNHPLGASWSYCNSGFVLLGHVIQRVTGQTWEQAIEARLASPLGLSRTVTLPQDAIRYSVATGHVPGADDELAPTPTWDLPRSLGPAGLIVQSTDEMLAFARMHMRGGVAADGTRILNEASVAAMAAHEVDLPDKITLGDSWGLGWIRFDLDGHRAIGHDGATIGQNGFLRILPEQNLAVAIVANGGNSGDFFRELSSEIFEDVVGISRTPAFAPPADPFDVDASAYVGAYDRAGVRIDVYEEDGVLKMTLQPTGDMVEVAEDKPQTFDLVAVSDALFAMRMPGTVGWSPVTFFTHENGRQYVHFGARSTPKVDRGE
ncbi:serine hydrolase [Microbacterium sp. NPDC076768]|uniref:serine hydrolase n=1 Tax=Microbacterium sp. NPDC076768 TaxID=3154858 RepID=UPI003443E02B